MIELIMHHGNVTKENIIPYLVEGYRINKIELRPLMKAPWTTETFFIIINELTKPLPVNSLFMQYVHGQSLDLDIDTSFSVFSRIKNNEKKWYRYVVLHLDKDE